MKQLIFLLFIIIPFISNTQGVIVNRQDSTFIASYDKVASIHRKTQFLKTQVSILIQAGGEYNTIIKKLRARDSLHYLEIAEYKLMDSILREENKKSDLIISKLDMLYGLSKDKLSVEEKLRKKERFWKNVYKFGYPALAVTIATLVIIK